MLLVDILYTIMLPIFSLIGIGFVLDKALNLNVQTLARLCFYVFTPVALLDLITRSDLQADEIALIGAYVLAHMIVMLVVSTALFSIKPLKAKRAVLTCSSLFYNAGYYGIPLMLLVFGEFGAGVIGIVLIMQALLMVTVGVLMLGPGEQSILQSLVQFLKIPAIYAIPIGFALRAMHIELGGPLKISLDHLVGGFVPMALITLGVQLSKSRISQDFRTVLSAAGMRLIASPLVAALLMLVFGFDQAISMVLILGAGLPTAINIYIIAAEFNRDPDLASLAVFWTTVMSVVSIPLWLLLIDRMYA